MSNVPDTQFVKFQLMLRSDVIVMPVSLHDNLTSHSFLLMIKWLWFERARLIYHYWEMCHFLKRSLISVQINALIFSVVVFLTCNNFCSDFCNLSAWCQSVHFQSRKFRVYTIQNRHARKYMLHIILKVSALL